MTSCVLDSSALLAFLHREEGHELVASLLDNAAVSAVNIAEVLARLAEAGLPEQERRAAVDALGVTLIPFDEESAHRTAALRVPTQARFIARRSGLSGDRDSTRR